jgi:hypothetical protein
LRLGHSVEEALDVLQEKHTIRKLSLKESYNDISLFNIEKRDEFFKNRYRSKKSKRKLTEEISHFDVKAALFRRLKAVV